MFSSVQVGLFYFLIESHEHKIQLLKLSIMYRNSCSWTGLAVMKLNWYIGIISLRRINEKYGDFWYISKIFLTFCWILTPMRTLERECGFGGVAAQSFRLSVISHCHRSYSRHLLSSVSINSGTVLKHCCLAAVIAFVTFCRRRLLSLFC